MTPDKPVSSSNPLEQFVLLAKSAKGAAAIELIKQVLEAPGVHVFGELLDMPNLIELENSLYVNYYNTLKLFAYGTYRQYLEEKDRFIELSPIMKKKLQHLTIVTLATKTKSIPYSVLLQELDMRNVRDLEDLIIEAIYADIIQGKLEQKSSQVGVEQAIGRDVRRSDLSAIVATLGDWCESCETVLQCIEQQMFRANSEKARRLRHKEAVDQEILNIKKTLKSQSQDPDEAMATDTREAASGGQTGGAGDKLGKKTAKVKRGTGKFWQK